MTSSLTGTTVEIRNLVAYGREHVPTFRAEVLATCFGISGRVDAVEVRVPGHGVMTVFEGFSRV